MSDWALKRFWKETTVGEVEGGWTVFLDGRPVRTPAKAPFVVPTRAYAEACAAEWDAQEGKVDPNSMPITRSANAAIDKLATQHAEVADMLAAYGETDLTCHRADRPEGLVARQAEAWDPLLDWTHATFGARLTPVAGVMVEGQEPDALARLAKEVHGLDAFRLAAFHDLVALSGSLVIGLACAQGHATPETLWDLSRIDESWQAEEWGEDEEATAQAALKRQAFLTAAHIFSLVERD